MTALFFRPRYAAGDLPDLSQKVDEQTQRHNEAVHRADETQSDAVGGKTETA